MKLLQLPLLALGALTPTSISGPGSTSQCLDPAHAHNYDFTNPAQSKLTPSGYLHETSNDPALPIPMNNDPLFFGGGAQRSYHPPALIDGQKPRLLTASEAAEWYPREWEGSVYAWKIFPPKDYHDSEPRLCLCQVEELCGCGSAAWKQREAARFDRTIMQSKGPKGWGVNGTAGESDLRKEWSFLSMATYDERRRVLKVEQEKGPTSRLCRATGGLWGWWVDWGHTRPEWCFEKETSEL